MISYFRFIALCMISTDLIQNVDMNIQKVPLVPFLEQKAELFRAYLYCTRVRYVV